MRFSRRKFLHSAAGTVALPAVIACAGLAILAAHTSQSQPAKLPQVGIVLAGPPGNFAAPLQSFREGLQGQGFVEDQTVKLVARYAPGSQEQLKQSAAELATLSVNVILTSATMATEAAKNATSTIPIVFAIAGDPVASGFVASFEKPGGNITGVVGSGPEMAGNRLEVLKEAAPTVSRVAVIGNSRLVQQANSKQSIEGAAKKLGIDLLFPDVSSGGDIPSAFQKARDWGADGYINLSQTLTNNAQEQIADLAAKAGRPLVVHTARGVEAGALISLNDDALDIFRIAGAQVGKILKGASPATLPVEKSSRPELIISLKAAKRLNLTLPNTLLSRATRVIQ